MRSRSKTGASLQARSHVVTAEYILQNIAKYSINGFFTALHPEFNVKT